MSGHNVKQIMDAVNLLAQPCGTTVAELGRRLSIKERQVYRVIKALEDEWKLVVLKDKAVVDGGIRYSLEKGQFKRFSEMKVADLNLSISEIMSLYFLKGHARLYKGTGIETEIERAFAKLDAFVPPGFGKRLDKIKGIFLPSTKFAKDYSKKEKIIDVLASAMLGRRTCLVEYHSFSDDRVKRFRIDPLRFFERDGGLYLFVRTTDYDDIRLLAAERIGSIDETGEVFSDPDSFDPEALLENAFGIVYDDPITVKIRFSAEQARYIQERSWAKNQKITKRGDGSIVLTMETSGWWDVKKWVLSFGSDAEVLEPKEMRDELLENARQLARWYGSN